MEGTYSYTVYLTNVNLAFYDQVGAGLLFTQNSAATLGDAIKGYEKLRKVHRSHAVPYRKK
jgi:hypothetical protein